MTSPSSPKIIMRQPRVPSKLRTLLAPNLPGDVDDKRKLGELLVLGQKIAEQRRGESALRRKRKLVQVDMLSRRIDAALDVVLRLQRAFLAGDQAENHDLSFGD